MLLELHFIVINYSPVGSAFPSARALAARPLSTHRGAGSAPGPSGPLFPKQKAKSGTHTGRERDDQVASPSPSLARWDRRKRRGTAASKGPAARAELGFGAGPQDPGALRKPRARLST